MVEDVASVAMRARVLRESHPVSDPPAGVDKVMPLSQAIGSLVRAGASIHVAYSDARPNGALLELLRQFDGTDPGFELSTSGLVSVQHALVSRGLLRRVITSFAGENYPAPRPSPVFQQAVADGSLEVENWSLYTLVARLIGGALGVEFFPVHSLVGSDMAKEHAGERFAEVSSPFTGSPTGVVRSHRPDVTIVQGVAADRAGNVVMAGPYGEAFWGAMAARQAVIACVERIVEPAEIRAHNSQTTIPGHVVTAVCEVPFGSHPYGLYNPAFPGVSSYVEDNDFLVDLQGIVKDGAEAFDRWIDEWLIEPGDHEGYLAKIGANTLSRLRGEADSRSWELEALAPDDHGGPATDTERMVVAAAHVLANRIRSQGIQAMLAGVGFSNLAAWLAARMLRETGDDVQLMAEIGMYGYDPRPGEPFIFSLRNLPSCTMLTDVTAVLGTFVSGSSTRAIGAVGSGMVDRDGNLNSTWSTDGRFLVGSGGANDIASAADELVVTVKQSAHRLVEAVPYVTSPGTRVRAIVTTEGVLERIDDEFELTQVHVRPGETERDVVDRVLEGTGWDLKISEQLTTTPEPTPVQLRTIRQFDPHRTFLR